MIKVSSLCDHLRNSLVYDYFDLFTASDASIVNHYYAAILTLESPGFIITIDRHIEASPKEITKQQFLNFDLMNDRFDWWVCKPLDTTRTEQFQWIYQTSKQVVPFKGEHSTYNGYYLVDAIYEGLQTALDTTDHQELDKRCEQLLAQKRMRQLQNV